MATEVVTETKSGALSKINWVAGIGILLTVVFAALMGRPISDMDTHQLIEFLGQVLTGALFLLIAVLRTWFTTKLTKASAQSLLKVGE